MFLVDPVDESCGVGPHGTSFLNSADIYRQQLENHALTNRVIYIGLSLKNMIESVVILIGTECKEKKCIGHLKYQTECPLFVVNKSSRSYVHSHCPFNMCFCE